MMFKKKFWGCFLAAALIAIAINMAGWRSLAFIFDRSALIQFFSAAGDRGTSFRSVGLFLLAHVAANAVGIPGTLLVVVGGAVYGLWWGTVWSVMGATLGAIAAFWLARYLLYDWFRQRFYHLPLLKKLNSAICRHSLGCVLTIRFSPVSPFNVVNFAFGLTPVPVRDYAAGTLIGIIPGTLAYTWLGVTGAEALSGGKLLPLICCLLMLMLLSAMPLIVNRIQT